jgi:hypothetical protein
MMISILFSILFGACLLGILISIVSYTVYNEISPMPTSQKAKKYLLKALPKDLPKGKIYELGSGWGTLAFPIAFHFSQTPVIAIENSPLPFLFSKSRFFLESPKNLKILKQNFFTLSLNDAALIICYLYPKGMQKLKIKFENELKSGTWVISNTFAIPGWKPVKVYEIHDLYQTKIYVYFYIR